VAASCAVASCGAESERVRPLHRFVVASCGAESERVRPLHRFVDAELRSGAAAVPRELLTTSGIAASDPRSTSGHASATIADRTRYVLFAHPYEVLVYRRTLAAPTDRRLRLDVPIGDSFPGADRLVLLTRHRAARAEGPWAQLAPLLGRVRQLEGIRQVDLGLDLPPGFAAPRLELIVAAYRPPDRLRTRYLTPEVEIPPGATLEFGMGVLEPAALQGPLRFSVSACDGPACTPIFSETFDPAADPAPAWEDRRVSLAALAGERRALLFETQHLAASPEAFSLPVWSDPTLLAASSQPAQRPNVILVSIDTLRADHLAVYGYARSTSPFLDTSLAERGVVLENVVAAATTTDPSHMTIFTSLRPSVHGATAEVRPLDVPVVTLAEAFRSGGFATAAFTENGPLDYDRGFGRGFDEYLENKSPYIMAPLGQVDRTLGHARRWVERNGDRPFFLFVHTFQVHSPYAPPEAYRALFNDASEGAPPRSARAGRDSQVSDLVDDYDREIRYVDDELRAFFEWLADEDLLANTFFIVVSDHGEGFYEHGALGHGALPHEELLGVPLILVGPGVTPGRRIAQPVAHVDLMPTLLDLAGVELPAHVEGHSFAKLLGGAAPDGDGDPQPLFSEAWVLPERFEPPSLAVRLGNRKLLRYSSAGEITYELYDLKADPGEQNDLYGTGSESAADLRTLLDDYELGVRARRAELGSSAGTARPVLLDPDREQKLRALGYVD
jgi:arylsulfatase A-like enzyme